MDTCKSDLINHLEFHENLSLYTALSRKVVGKSARDNPERHCGYLVSLMFRMPSNQHYPHRANQRLRSWANAVFQNRGVCGQAVPSFPSPSPVIHSFFRSCPSFLDEPGEETLATQASVY